MRYKCNFCGTEKDDSELIEGNNGTYICFDCIETCHEAMGLDGNYEEQTRKELPKIMKPGEIYRRLNEYVIGQDEAKKSLSVAVYNHYKRMVHAQPNADIEIQKSNLLMLGPTGSGKTYLAKTLARILDVPFAIADATSLTEAGYVGADVESVLTRLVKAADGDIERAKYGIIYIDEIDKLCHTDRLGKDPSGEGVQQALLKLIEGTEAELPSDGGPVMLINGRREKETLDTTNILFICGGAFDGLEKIIKNRKADAEAGIGFNSTVNKKEEKTLSQSFAEMDASDLTKYGMIPELAGRLPITICLDDLSEDDMVKILAEPKNALLKQYKELFAYDHVELKFTDGAIRQIAKRAIKRKTGARGLRSIIEKSMRDLMFDAPDQEGLSAVVVSEDVINGTKRPEYHYTSAQ